MNSALISFGASGPGTQILPAHFGLFRQSKDADFLRSAAKKETRPKKSVLEQEMEFYEIRKGARSEYGTGSLGEGPASESSIGLYRSGGNGPENLYSAANSSAIYGSAHDHKNMDGFDRSGKIIRKFIWE